MSDVLRRIGDICEQIRGVTYSKDEAVSAPAPGFKPMLRANNITEHGLSFEDLVYVPERRVSARQYVKVNDVVIAASSGSIDVVGKAARAAIDFDGGFGAFCKVLRPSAEVDPGYFAHFFRTSDYRRRVSAVAAGANINNLRNEHIDDLEITLPSLAKQRYIAAILDEADALRAKRRVSIEKLDQLLRSVYLDMFGDPVENPKNWPKVPLSGLFDIARGGSPRPIDAYITDASDGVNWIMIGDTVDGSKYIDVTRKKIRKEGVSRSRMVRPGDFLLTNSMSFGRPYILRTSGCIHDGWLVLSPKDARTSQDYLHSALSSPSIYTEFSRRAPGATVKNLNIDLVSGVEIPVPPSDLQAVFSKAIQKIEVQGQRLQQQGNRLDTLFATLQHRAFAGTL